MFDYPSARVGVDSTVKYAVFLVDSSLTQSGEGLCKPDDQTCSFLYLSLANNGDEHNFTDDQGTEYTLKLLKINKVSVDSSSSSSAQGSSADGSSTGFGSQVFTDLVTRH